MSLAGKHILSVDQFERADLERIFAVADSMAPFALRQKVTR
ncbi:MAG TPA: aspartate carbamoyltransferase, partial [Cellvibrionaceae bacterium]|nr:aspartate carbamoyltransferase [Cellvibrionaceae bacterium]